MLLQNSIQKTKSFILKSLQNLRNFLFGGYEENPRTLVLNPLSCASISQTSHQLDHIYSNFTNQSVPDWDDQNNADRLIKQSIDIDANHRRIGIRSSYESMGKKLKKSGEREMEATSSSCSTKSYMVLSQKMKELEMMDMSDVDHSLDVEEALHYYSRLTCPVYVDIVNKFFMDMYAEFLLPQPSITRISSSSRRLTPLTL